MTKSLPLDYAPMEASAIDSLPAGDDWQYEPKWDGFRCIAFRHGDTVELMSKSGKPLTRYFPEVAATLLALEATTFVLDGEIVIVAGKTLSFDDLLQRIHPAASRVRKLSTETPATYVVFDLLADAKGSRVDLPLVERRTLLEAFASQQFTTASIVLSPVTHDVTTVMKWFDQIGGGLDGVMAKRTDLPYQSGERTGMQKLKHSTTIDCSVCTTMGDSSITLDSCRGSSGPTAPRSPARWRHSREAAALPAMRRVVPAAGARSVAPSGCRSSLNWWSRSRTITSPVVAFGTAPVSCAGGPTRRRASVPWRSCHIPVNRQWTW
jgi:hypothetical protein